MKTSIISLTCLFIILLNCGFKSQKSSLIETIEFASLNRAIELLSTEDLYTNSWSQFDIDSRLHKSEGTKQELFKFITSCARDWQVDDKKIIIQILGEIDEEIKVQGFNIPYPKKIYLLTTTMEEEGNALGYTRSNFIVLNESKLSGDKESIKKIIIHELFHVISRNQPDFRRDFYEMIGFKITNVVAYPKEIEALKITNPDAPQSDAYITLQTKDGLVDCMMIIYSTKNYDGGSFFDYLNIGFLRLDGTKTKTAYQKDGKAIIYTLKEAINFLEQVGKNTQYIIHPEEIMAENFTHTLSNVKGLTDQWVVDKIERYLKK